MASTRFFSVGRSWRVLAAMCLMSLPAVAHGADYRFTTFAGAPPGGSADGAGPAARFNLPTGVAVDGAGYVYVADRHNHTIRKISPAGVVTTLAGLAGDGGTADGPGAVARFFRPSAVAVDVNGFVYVADTYNNTIRKITPGGVVSTLAGLGLAICGNTNGPGDEARFCRPSGIAVGPDGTVYVADAGNAQVRKITAAGVVTTLAGDGRIGTIDGPGDEARFLLPTGIAVNAAGTVYVADQDAHLIRAITPAGVVSTLAGLGSTPGSADGIGSAARFDLPFSVTVDAAGTLYVADTRNQTIRRVTPAGEVSTIGGTAGAAGNVDAVGSFARFRTPYGVAVDANGTVYVADTNNFTIRRGTIPSSGLDVDGDGQADLTVYRPGDGNWFIRQSQGGYANFSIYQWGLAGDLPKPADFDGDGAADLVVYRPSTGEWFIRASSSGYVSFATYQWGLPGDTPLPGDFDGDGKADLAVYRPSAGQWFIRFSGNGYDLTKFAVHQWGLADDIPLLADFDGDGRTELTVYRPSSGQWFVRFSTQDWAIASFSVYQWGLPGDTPLVADFDADGKTDLTVYRPSAGLWFVETSSTGYAIEAFSVYQWGLSDDIPLVADFDGDGKAELTVYRPSSGQWFIRLSASGYNDMALYQWGLPGDVPLAGP